MTSFSTRGWRVLILLAIVILLISTASHAQAPRKVKMTLPVVALTTAPVYLAETKGYFAQEGLTVDITVTGGGGPDIKALIAGDVDFTYTASDQVILPWQEGRRLTMIMGVIPRALINWAMHKDVAQAKGITEKSSLADKLKALRGLTIGTTQAGSLTANLAAYTLRKAGLVPQQDCYGHSSRKRLNLARSPRAAQGRRRAHVASVAGYCSGARLRHSVDRQRARRGPGSRGVPSAGFCYPARRDPEGPGPCAKAGAGTRAREPVGARR